MKTPEELELEKESTLYPDSDGQPMADNTEQFDWITTIKGSVNSLFAKDPKVFVAGDLHWYPVQGRPEIHCATDVLVAFGRPRGRRGSYRQWREENIPPQVVFEIWSPGNDAAEIERKFQFYQEYGVEEYYTYDPGSGELAGWVRAGEFLRPVEEMDGWVSPRLKIRFLMAGRQLDLRFPDGRPFLTFVEEHQARQEAERILGFTQQQRAMAERDRATAERLRDEAERRAEEDRKARAEAERLMLAERNAREEIERQREADRKAREDADKRTSDALSLATLLAEHLRTLGINPDELRKGG